MKKVLWGLSIVVLSLVGVISSDAIVRQVGITGQCDTTISTCFPPPVLTQNCVSPALCTRVSASDPTNANVFYGTDGTNCRKSVNGAVTWANCTTNPQTTVMFHYAVNMDGQVLVAGHNATNSAFIIQKSDDGAVSWSNVYSSATLDTDAVTVYTQRIACARTTLICIAAYRSGIGLIALSSNDGGATWSGGTLGANSAAVSGVVINEDGTSGFAAITGGDGTANFKGGVWNGSSWAFSASWPNTGSTVCVSGFFSSSNPAIFCKDPTASVYTIRNASGVLLSTITLPNGHPGAPSTYTGYMLNLRSTTTKPLIIFGLDSRGGSSVWTSIDATTFVQTTILNDAGTGVTRQGSAYLANGCGYFSSNQQSLLTGLVLKVC